jgi:hypothetical protein
MPNVRALNKNKYNISNFRFRELYYYCLQYSEWKEELQIMRNPLKGMQYSDMPGTGAPGNPTETIGIRCEKLSRKCGLIERAAALADPELKNFIIYAVTNEKISFTFLKQQKNIPCESDRYYNSRRKFYFYLDKLLKEDEA